MDGRERGREREGWKGERKRERVRLRERERERGGVSRRISDSGRRLLRFFTATHQYKRQDKKAWALGNEETGSLQQHRRGQGKTTCRKNKEKKKPLVCRGTHRQHNLLA